MVPNNENYGTFEAPLNQENSDPVSDMLYTTNFAIIGLHEAAAALAPYGCLLYTSPSPRDGLLSRMPSSA